MQAATSGAYMRAFPSGLHDSTLNEVFFIFTFPSFDQDLSSQALLIESGCPYLVGFVPWYQEKRFLIVMSHVRGKMHTDWKPLKPRLSNKEEHEEEHSGISHLKSIFHLGCKHWRSS